MERSFHQAMDRRVKVVITDFISEPPSPEHPLIKAWRDGLVVQLRAHPD